MVGVGHLVETVTSRQWPKFMVRWRVATRSPEAELSRELADAITRRNTGKLALGVGVRQDSLDSLFSEWFEHKELRHRILLVRGKHGTGKTCALVTLASRVVDRWPEVEVLATRGSFPEDLADFARMGLAAARPFLVIIDDAPDEWLLALAQPAVLLPPNAVFILSLADPDSSPRLRRFRSLCGARAAEVALADGLDEDAIKDVVGVLRPALPLSNAEQLRLRGRNVRQLVAALESTGTQAPFAMPELLNRHEVSVGALLLASSLCVEVPGELVERMIGGALPSDVGAWVLRRHHSLFLSDPAGAEDVLNDRYLTTWARRRVEIVDALMSASDPLQPAERRFIRALLHALSDGHLDLVEEMLQRWSAKVAECIDRESAFVVAFGWLPICATANRSDLLERIVRRLPQRPETVGQFALWIHVNGEVAAQRYLSERLKGLTISDPLVIVRFARLVRLVSKSERRPLARAFVGVLARLPRAVLFAALSTPNAFELIAAFGAKYGRAPERLRLLEAAGTLMRLRIERELGMSQTWRESHDALFERTILQSRNFVALKLTRSLVGGTSSLSDAAATYSDLYRNESSQDFSGFGAAALEVFGELSEHDVVRYERPSLAANVLRLALSWCRPPLAAEVRQAYLAALTTLSQAGVGIERVAPIVTAGFRVFVKHFAEEERRVFLGACVEFLRQNRSEATEESSRFIINLLMRVQQTVTPGGDLHSIASEATTGLHRVGAAERVAETINAILREYSLRMPRLKVSSWLSADWTNLPGLVAPYLELLRQTLAVDEANGAKCRDILRSVAGGSSVLEKSALLLLRLRLISEAGVYVERLAQEAPTYHNLDGLRALVAAVVGDLGQAYGYMARTLEGDKDRLDPWLAVTIHRECARHAADESREIHSMCAALGSPVRLVSPTTLGVSGFKGRLSVP